LFVVGNSFVIIVHVFIVLCMLLMLCVCA